MVTIVLAIATFRLAVVVTTDPAIDIATLEPLHLVILDVPVVIMPRLFLLLLSEVTIHGAVTRLDYM